MGDGADDAYDQAVRELEEFQVHEANKCEGPGKDEEGCYFCNNPKESEELRQTLKANPGYL